MFHKEVYAGETGFEMRNDQLSKGLYYALIESEGRLIAGTKLMIE